MLFTVKKLNACKPVSKFAFNFAWHRSRSSVTTKLIIWGILGLLFGLARSHAAVDELDHKRLVDVICIHRRWSHGDRGHIPPRFFEGATPPSKCRGLLWLCNLVVA